VSWDETLEEGVNPAPSWWFWLGISAAIFAVFYMILPIPFKQFQLGNNIL
jgi:hypothetical protein